MYCTGFDSKAHTTSMQAEIVSNSSIDYGWRELMIRAGTDKDKTDMGTMMGDWNKG